jgi:hypothetical protein
MISIADPRAEKAARKLAKQLNMTISEAVAIACERILHEQDDATRGKRRRQQLDRVLADIWKRHKLPASEAERARLAGHGDLYGPDGLPR